MPDYAYSGIGSVLPETKKASFENNEPFKGIKWRKVLHPILINGLKIMYSMEQIYETIYSNCFLQGDI